MRAAAAQRVRQPGHGYRLENSVMGPAEVVSHRERFLDDLQLMVDPGLEFENNTAFGDGFRLENDVSLTATVDIGDRIARVQIFDGHQFRASV